VAFARTGAHLLQLLCSILEFCSTARSSLRKVFRENGNRNVQGPHSLASEDVLEVLSGDLSCFYFFVLTFFGDVYFDTTGVLFTAQSLPQDFLSRLSLSYHVSMVSSFFECVMRVCQYVCNVYCTRSEALVIIEKGKEGRGGCVLVARRDERCQKVYIFICIYGQGRKKCMMRLV
jgi:hypothetical protein